MPFMLYDVTAGPSSRSYRCVRQVRIAGNTGPLAHIQRTRNAASTCPFGWHATSEDIVAALGGQSSQAVVIDLKPTVARNVSLYLLRDVWGFSDRNWTPLALRLESLFVDLDDPNPLEFKAAFDDSEADRTLIGEFLYVQGGVAGGTWNWGKAGRVNGTLLWPAAFEYLGTRLGQALRG
jgi:hypothetical protein